MPHLKLCCAPGIELIGLIIAWKPFPKLCCVLNVLTMNHLALESSKSDLGCQSQYALGFHSHVFCITACDDTCQYPHNINMFKVVTEWFMVLLEKYTKWKGWIPFCYLDIWKTISHCTLGSAIKDERSCQGLWNRS